MIYNNLLFFLVAIFMFSMDSAPEIPMFSPWTSLVMFVMTLVGFDRLCVFMFSRRSAFTSAGYFSAEKRLTVGALLFFGVGALYLSEAKYYLSILSIGERLPALVNVGGLALFLLYLSIMWRIARRNYQYVFGKRYTSAGFILSNIKANLPIVLPWVVLSLCYDLLSLIPLHPVQAVLASQWGDVVFFGMFLIFVILFFPPLVRRLWGCSPLPEGDLKARLDRFCHSQKFKAELFLWPLFEGKVLTAGVMGIIPGMRYVLLTPAIIQSMTIEELESVMAHEIGHIKRYHLLLYLFLICSFSVFAGLYSGPAVLSLLSQDFVVGLVTSWELNLEQLLAISYGVVLLVAMIIYFRFIFGYFMRNFERQADLHVIKAVGSGRALISAFEKISSMSGDIRDQKNWHHFGIGERIDCLHLAEQKPETIQSHDRKVRYSLLAFVFVLALSVTWVWKGADDQIAQIYQNKYQEAVLLKMTTEQPDKAIWHMQMGDFMLSKKRENKALVSYEKAFSLEPANPEIMNNLAWLLLTSEDHGLRDPLKALTLARSAATLQPKGYILDTLATAYWANGFVEEAVESEKQAAFADPDQRRFYMTQAQRFLNESYEESMLRQKKQENS